MMHGYDKDAAVEFITRCIRKADHPELAEDIPALVPQMIDADMAYMHEAGVLDADGYAGDAYYEDDEAIEYIVESLAAKNALDPEQAVKLAALVDDYLDAQQMFWNRRVWWSTRNNHFDYKRRRIRDGCVAFYVTIFYLRKVCFQTLSVVDWIPFGQVFLSTFS